MSLRSLPWLVLLLSVSGCSFDQGRNPARGCDDTCPAGACYLGYCLASGSSDPNAPGAGPGSGGASAEAGRGTPGGTSGSSASGTSGTSAMPSAGAGGASTSGGAGSPTPGQSCSAGMSGLETCNGLDDDCDGLLDENTVEACYPTATVGCVPSATSGSYTCAGLCAAGSRACVNGKPGACEGFVGPTEEQCGGDQAADEDCDGAVDDDCPCSGTETQRCYSGRAFSAGIGPCRSGTQHCHNGAFGPCEGEVVPVAESCANQGADDNCNFALDDVPGAGSGCFDWSQQGVCFSGTRSCRQGALVCVTPEPEDDEIACDGRDEDCDGEIDEDFVFSDDPMHCGNCSTRCAAGDVCCDGQCRDPDSDAAHCGGCDLACDGDEACCGGDCVETTSDDHCGSCKACPPGQSCCGEDGCVETTTDEHCGGCNACPSEQTCCDEGCVDTSNDAANCGGCGHLCPEACSCQSGHCVDAELMMCP